MQSRTCARLVQGMLLEVLKGPQQVVTAENALSLCELLYNRQLATLLCATITFHLSDANNCSPCPAAPAPQHPICLLCVVRP